MGSIETRLSRLEELSQERAVEELRRAWARLSDKEIALILGRLVQPDMHQDGDPEEESAVEKARVSMLEELIAVAIGFTEHLDTEEIDRRIKALTKRLGIFERGAGIRRHMRAVGERRQG